MNTTDKLLQFLNRCPSAYHAVKYFTDALDQNGFIRLNEPEDWTIRKGGNYYCTRNGSSLIAFRIPNEKPSGFMVAASHSDSPSFKIKPICEIENEGLIRLNVESYGGLLIAPWFDRPLTVAGRVLVRDGNEIHTRLLYIDRDLLIIPSLAIHMNRQVNEGYAWNIQKELLPLFGSKENGKDFTDVLAEELGVMKENVFSFDLFLVPRMKASRFGAENEFIASPHLDDLECSFANFEAFLCSENKKAVPVFALFDNEEVGSSTAQGADSTFLSGTLERIQECLTHTANEYHSMISRSFMISLDNAHAVHPAYPDKADPTNRPKMNQGVVVKFCARGKYATDGLSAAVIRMLGEKAEVPLQVFANRSDMRGGSTLGNISIRHVSMMTADIGLAQLAMHSPCETSGAKDPDYLFRLMKTYYASSISHDDYGNIRIH